MVLREWRTRNRVTLARLGDAVGVSRGHLSFFESGKKRLSPELAKRIEAFTRGEVSAASLLGVSESRSRRRGVSEDAAPFGEKEHLSMVVPLSVGVLKDLQNYGVDAEAVARAGAQHAIKEAYAQAFREANREATEAYNAWIDKHGTLAEQLGLI